MDRYANKVWLIIIWPIIATLLHLFLIIYRTKIVARSQNNKMHTIISWSIPLGNNILLSYIFAYGLGNHINITSILLPTIGILFIALGNYMPKTQQNRFVGIRIPTALNNDINWFKTQRIGGGFLGMISEFWTIALMILSLVLITVVPIIYPIRSSHKA
ncbi:SdpI family protein [Leuconostoc mesenteroides]|uniref:SdpI family protein n=1 Tax=Leuconostoc mesenteroides TaxID=1245 RepID=UPI001CBBDCF9|nr:SdpI family protein [Leuconostoc mesenteroides]